MDEAGTATDEFVERVTASRTALFRFAMTLTSSSEADDLVQDALTRAWTKRDQYDASRGSVQAWLLAIVANQARTRRRRRRPAETYLSLDTVLASPVDQRSAEVWADVTRAVNQLPARQRLAVVLSIYVDLPQADVASLMGCSVGTVKASLHTARQRLTSALGEDYGLD